jgi:O-antigen/teichoic acid export membrane protein
VSHIHKLSGHSEFRPSGSDFEVTDKTNRVVALAQRTGWGIADQALSSLTNFALGVVIARAVGPAAFGAFTLVFVVYTTALGVSRAVTSEPLLVHYSADPYDDWHVGVGRATGVAALIGVVAGIACAIAASILSNALTLPLLALAVTLPGLLLQDCWRFAFFARGRGSSAFVNDLVWAVVLFPALLVPLHAASRSIPALAVLVWGGAGTVAGLVGIRQAGIVPAPRQLLRWLRDERALIPRFLGEFAAIGGAGQVSVYAIGAIAGLAALGALRGAQLVFGPMQVLFMGVSAIAIPELVRARQASTARFFRASRLISASLVFAALGWGIVVLALPLRVGVALLGPTWLPAHLLAAAVLVSWVASGSIAGAASGLRAVAAVRRSLAARVVGSGLAACGAVAGAILDGARGAAWGMALTGCIEAMVWWWQYMRTLRELAPVQDGSRETSAVPADAVTLAESC